MAVDDKVADAEAQLQATLNVIPAYTWYALPSGALTFVNERTADYLGLPKDHPLRFGIDTGAEWDSHIPLLHPDDREESRKAWSTCLRTGSAVETSFRVRDAKGGYRWFLSRVEPLRASDGTLLYWIGVNLDIENARRAEQELRDVIDTIPAIVWSTLPDGSNTYANKRFVEYTGSSAEQMAGSGWQTLIHPDDLERHAAKWMEAVATGKPHESEVRSRRSDGQYRWQLDRGVPLRDEDGNIVRWYGVTTDIEDRKRAEEDLRRNEFYLAEGQRLAHMGSWVFNPAGFFSHWSRELLRIYGLDPAQEAPNFEEYLALIHPQDREFMRSLITKMVAEALGCDVTKRIVRPNGELRYIRCVGTPVVENGTLQRIVGTAMDVTEHELLTQELRRREAYLAEAQKLSHTGSFGWKPDSGEIIWSAETYRIFEYDRAVTPTIDLVGQRVHPEDRADFQSAIERASEGAPDLEHAYRLLLPDGRVKHVHALAHATQDASGTREFVGAVTDVTDHKRAEESLRASEAYLVEAQRLSHTGSWSWSPATDVKHWSEECYRILGFDPRDGLPGAEEIIQRIHPDDQPAVREIAKTAKHNKLDEEMDYRILHPGGAVKYIHSIGHPVFSPSGDLIEYTGTAIDVTERKRAEESLRASEAYLAEAQRLSQTGSWAWSPDRDIRYWSEECYRVLSFDPQNGLPRFEDFFQRLHPDDQPGFRELIQTAIREKSEWEADYRIVHPDGPVRDIHLVAHPVLSTSGHLLEFVGTVIDVTERKRAEEELRRSEAELRQMLDFTPQLIAVYGCNRERLYANRIALDYLGMSLAEWRQRSFGAEIHPDDLEPVRSYWERASSNGSAHESEVRFRKCDGSFRWFLVRFNPLHDEKGQITRWYIACTDIDDRKRAEEKLQLENAALREEIDQTSMFEEIVGTSPALQTVLSRISKVAPSGSTVLITGETGTGKELVARAIHRRSQRSGRAFVSVNCAAIPRDLIASELFGHEKGAFTGAMQRRLGRFEMADGGTIFLDEVGELSPDTQIALLRVLQEREFERVGGGHPIRVDVRVIAATNRDLQAGVANGTFRQDLFYRFNVFPIEVPPLRERKDDILMLVEYFAQRYATRAGKAIRSIEKKTLELLQCYDWPGNIRELQNVIERSMILSSGEVLSVDEMWLSNETSLPASRIEAPVLVKGEGRIEPGSEREIIEAALVESRGRVSGPSGAAAKLGIPPSTLDHRIKALKIAKRQFKFL